MPVINALLYRRLPPAELPGAQRPSCSLMVQVEAEAGEVGEAGLFPSTSVSGFTLHSSTMSNSLERSSALILTDSETHRYKCYMACFDHIDVVYRSAISQRKDIGLYWSPHIGGDTTVADSV